MFNFKTNKYKYKYKYNRNNVNREEKREWCIYWKNFPHRLKDQVTGQDIPLRLLGDGSTRKICEDCINKIKIIKWYKKLIKNGEIPANKPQLTGMVGREIIRGEWATWNRPIHKTEPYQIGYGPEHYFQEENPRITSDDPNREYRINSSQPIAEIRDQYFD